MNFRKLMTATATLAVLGSASSDALADERTVITCPTGHKSSFANGTFRCSKPRTEFAMTISPAAYPNYVVRGGRDVCTNVSTLNLPYVGEFTIDARKMALPLPAAVGGGWSLVENGDSGANDRCTRIGFQPQPTVPEFELSSAGWTLTQDGFSGRGDRWSKRQFGLPLPFRRGVSMRARAGSRKRDPARCISPSAPAASPTATRRGSRPAPRR